MIIPLENGSRPLTYSVVNTTESLKISLIDAAGMAKQDPVLAVHTVRKRLKLFRAFLKLFQIGSDPEKLEAANYFLRDLARNFSVLRDAHVRTETMKNLLTEPVFLSTSNTLEKLIDVNIAETEALETEMIGNIDIFGDLNHRIREETEISGFLSSAEFNPGQISIGLSGTFETCCSAYYSSYLFPSAELLHEWRKRVKDLQYQYELTQHFRPPELEPGYEDLLSLAEFLGHDQDLNNLGVWVTDKSPILEAGEAGALISSLKSRRNRLKAGINYLGKSFFSTDPCTFRSNLNSFVSNGKG